MSELLPCPFCNGKTKLASRNSGYWYVVICDECAAQGRSFNNEQDAIDCWNRRAIDPTLERLKEAAVAYGNGSTRWKGYDNDLKATAEAYAASRKAKT